MEILHLPGDTIGDRYQVLTLLGQGGMGTTYEAEQMTTGDRVAIKVLSLRQMRDWKVLELFEREARVLENLSHPNIPKYLDFFHIDTPDDRRFYLVRELIAGDSLAQLVQKGWRFDEEKAKPIARQVLNLLSYLHSLNPPMIHRDIKPENIIYQPEGKVFLVDFGSVQEVYRQTLMGSNTFVGTMGYMPPEQLRGQVSAPSDLYGLGATLLFLLTHQSPDRFPQHRMRIDFRSQVNLSHSFATWLEKLLEPAFEDRFSSANQALQALSPASLSKVKPPYPPFQTLRNKRIILQKTSQQLRATFPTATSAKISGWKTLLGVVLILIGTGTGAILLWIPGLLLLTSTLEAAASTESIDINLQTFQHCRALFGATLSCTRRPIEAIDRIELDLSLTDESSTIHFICKSDERYPFGAALSRAEQVWLAKELSDFLKQLKASH